MKICSRSATTTAQALGDVEGIDIGQGHGQDRRIEYQHPRHAEPVHPDPIDGRRQNAAGNVTPNGFSETSTSFMPPLSAIERIEVIRGPMSTLYGSDAMGGVINIITRKVAKEWTGSLTQDYTYRKIATSAIPETPASTPVARWSMACWACSCAEACSIAKRPT